MRTWTVAFLVMAACGSGGKPSAPETNDPAFTITGKAWYLVGNAATPGDETIRLVVSAKAGTKSIDAWIGEADEPRSFVAQGDGTFALEMPAADLPVGDHDVLLVANDSSKGFATTQLHRSAPYYVLVTTDWDFADPGDRANTYQVQMHADHPELRLTHFVGPYTFTDPTVMPARRAELVQWLLTMRDTHDDEIGLHIHPYCNFVESAGLTCITDQSTVYAAGDTTGYTIKVSAYPRDQMGVLLDHANTLFQQAGLDRTRTFRAGGWTASLATLQALADKGFTADTSALNWARIEEWKSGIPGPGGHNGELYRWNMENWNPINDTTQPYWVSQSNVLTDDAPTMPILEVPDNGVMIDYVTLEEMNGLFDTNWDRKAFEKPRTLMMGFHPSSSFDAAEYGRVDGFLDYADNHLAARGTGPVVYITLEDVVAAFAP